MECAFGILVKRFALLVGPMVFTPNRCKNFIFAAVILHNYLREAEIRTGKPPPEIELQIMDEYLEALRERAQPPRSTAKIYRERFVEFFALNC